MMGEDASIALQHYLELEIQRRGMSDPVRPADLLKILLSSQSNMRVRSCMGREYLSRIAQVAYERYNARRIADGDTPTLAIVPEQLTRRQMSALLGDRVNYVLIFGAESVYFQDTVHALAVDAARDGSRANVLGAHFDWLSRDGMSVGRAMAVGEDGVVREVGFCEPVPIHVVHILHLPTRCEQKLHKELSIRFSERGIPQVNPYEGVSERADDKAWSHYLWKKHGWGVSYPEHVLIPKDSSAEEIIRRLTPLIEGVSGLLVVQPDRSTEGYKVERFAARVDPKHDPSAIVRYIQDQILPEDDAIVREERGNVRYGKKGLRDRDLSRGNFLNVTFRFNVAWSGSEFVAESGYAQIAGDAETFPASRGRGGSVIDVNEAFANLYYRSDEGWARFIPAQEDVAIMKTAAVSAAEALNAGLDERDYLKLMGVDILLEVKGSDASNVVPVILEANSRPAGLSHSSEIVGISDKEPHPLISTEIFRYIRSLIDSR